jgi:hypothetical protein
MKALFEIDKQSLMKRVQEEKEKAQRHMNSAQEEIEQRMRDELQ